MDPHFLQSTSWETFHLGLNHRVFRQKSADFEFFAILEQTSLGNYLFCPYGPVLDADSDKSAKKSLKSALKSLRSLAYENHAFFVRIEPVVPFSAAFLQNLGLKKSKNLDPADTWILDLTPDESALISGFSQGTRTRFHNFAKKGLSVEATKDPAKIAHLVSLQQNLAKIKKIGTFSENYLKSELSQDFATLYLVHYEDKVIAASLFFDSEDTRFYMQSAADPAYRKLPATVALLTTAIFDAKAKGLKNFDFWGIAPENAPQNHPWAGFTEFKKSFGGRSVHYSGTWDLPISPLKYHLYCLVRALNRKFRQIK